MAVVSYIQRTLLPPLAFVKNPGSKRLGAVFCPGYMSSMDGQKALSLEKHMLSKGHPFLRFDYTNTGKSVHESHNKEEISFKQWTDDVLRLVDNQTTGPLIMIGSSMGSWMSLITAIERPHRVKGLMLIAPSVDFFGKHFRQFPAELQEKLMKGETVSIQGPYGMYLASRRVYDESREFEILSREGKLPIKCPVRIFHGIGDASAPYQLGLELSERFESDNVEILLRKAGEHRLSTQYDIDLLLNCVDSLLRAVSKDVIDYWQELMFFCTMSNHWNTTKLQIFI